MNEQEIDKFSNLIEQKTNALIKEKFGYSLELNSNLYHFTNDHNGQIILDSQSFWASFIRSTSDSLEFSLPLSHCRDWLCIENELFDFSKNFPAKLFSHFNEQAIDPIARYYFISLTENSNSPHHVEMYGNCTLKFTFTNFPEGIADYFMVLKCHYSADVKQEIKNFLMEWKNVFVSALNEINISVEKLPHNSWFYMFMRYCHMCSLCIKQSAFQDEKEIRIVFVPKKNEIDVGCSFHDKRGTRSISKNSFLLREYIPLNLKSLGITVSKA